MAEQTEARWWRSAERRERCKSLRTNATEAEQLAWTLLKKKQAFGLRFRRQHPIGPYVADFACLHPKVVIELDGPVHQAQTGHDQERDQALRALGFDIIRMTNDAFLADPDGLLVRIKAVLDNKTPPHPREWGGGRGEGP